MNRFAISCLLGLGALAVSQASVATTWADAGNNGNRLNAQELTGFDNTITNFITGSLWSSGPNSDSADWFKFGWGGGDVIINVAFNPISDWPNSSTAQKLIFTGTLCGNFACNSSVFQPVIKTDDSIYVFNGRTTQSPDNSGANATSLPELAQLGAPATATNAFYYLGLQQSNPGGEAFYTVTFSPVTTTPPGSTPEPGTLALMFMGLSLMVFNRRRPAAV